MTSFVTQKDIGAMATTQGSPKIRTTMMIESTNMSVLGGFSPPLCQHKVKMNAIHNSFST
jgi:hypothetical protein